MSEKSSKSDIPREEQLERKKKKDSLTFEELRKVLSVCDTLEDQALVELGVTTGIRREDIASIELHNIDLEERKLTFWEEKKDRAWTVPLEPEVDQTLKKYINTLPQGQRFLFDFSGRTAYRRFQALLQKAGIEKTIPFHGLRRTCMRLSKQMGRSMRYVMDLTGDTAETILEEYEGFTVEEMNGFLDKDSIMKRVQGMKEDREKYRAWLGEELRRLDQDEEGLSSVD